MNDILKMLHDVQEVMERIPEDNLRAFDPDLSRQYENLLYTLYTYEPEEDEDD